MKDKILVTGGAGFIGFHLVRRLLSQGKSVVSIDNLNNYYDLNLKYNRLKELGFLKNQSKLYNQKLVSKIYGEKLIFYKLDIQDDKNIEKIFKKFNFEFVCNLAAQAGVRYSIENPKEYISSNVNGFINIIENCKNYNVKKLVYASSSSVYGNSDNIPFNENANVDNPISIYAASKKSNELIAHVYSNLFQMETIGLRFFTVYGPWGRPDMALFLFTKAIINDEPINIYNYGNLSRDFTYIDDIIDGIEKTIFQNSNNHEFYKIYNIGNSKPVKLLDFINCLEKKLNKKSKRKLLPMQKGDVYRTWADTSKLSNDFEYFPNTSIEDGIEKFVNWYITYYKLN